MLPKQVLAARLFIFKDCQEKMALGVNFINILRSPFAPKKHKAKM